MESPIIPYVTFSWPKYGRMYLRLHLGVVAAGQRRLCLMWIGLRPAGASADREWRWRDARCIHSIAQLAYVLQRQSVKQSIDLTTPTNARYSQSACTCTWPSIRAHVAERWKIIHNNRNRPELLQCLSASGSFWPASGSLPIICVRSMNSRV